MNKSDSIKALAIALNKAQSEMSGAKKGSANPFFKSKYANLEEVIVCAKEPLHNNGLSVAQFPITEDNKAGVTTILMHTSGEWMEGTLLLACSKIDPQGMGSAITYARRYAYQAILGIPSEDDDGNGASKVQAPKPAYKQPVKAEAKQHGPTKEMVISYFKNANTKAGLDEKWSQAAGYGFAEDKDIIKAYQARARIITALEEK